ncbi:hypothetical protein CVT24_001644 [Panaeolus cyanescens]|uniref:DUF1996 domain-containing protein n=1 Tax=Panaeolus cyanescens TaxID=181874 RepID=A0A409VT07_9AGAR|nr:hypothetical protein CVT24_001644 [Panaeolus cyanescens]
MSIRYMVPTVGKFFPSSPFAQHMPLSTEFALNSTFDTLRTSTCTSCLVAQDLSNYWFPKLYFRDPQTGKFEDVPNGGLLVYYQNRGNADVAQGGPGLKAFPPGLKMISGSPIRRSRKYPPGSGSQQELAERAIEWSCLRYTATTGYDSTQLGMVLLESLNANLPYRSHQAPMAFQIQLAKRAGLNARIHMPACWDGVNLDSADHISHTAFLSELDNGDCPSTHPVAMMKMLYEVTWDVQSMATRWDPTKDTWPFVYSDGDSTGYSWHADFQNGWDVEALQNAIDKCNNPSDATGQGDTSACQFLTVLPADNGKQCKIDATVTEPITGVLDRLPGYAFGCIRCFSNLIHILSYPF